MEYTGRTHYLRTNRVKLSYPLREAADVLQFVVDNPGHSCGELRRIAKENEARSPWWGSQMYWVLEFLCATGHLYKGFNSETSVKVRFYPSKKGLKYLEDNKWPT